jgi:predicted Ser/Thr protein kinase
MTYQFEAKVAHRISELLNKTQLTFSESIELEKRCYHLSLLALKLRQPLESELIDPKPFLSILGNFQVGKLLTYSGAYIYELECKNEVRILRKSQFSDKDTSEEQTIKCAIIASELGIGPKVFGNAICKNTQGDNVYYIIMQKLSTTLNNNVISVAIVDQVLELVYALLVKGSMYHIDVHAENVMFDEHGKMYLIDFENCKTIEKSEQTTDFYYGAMIDTAENLLFNWLLDNEDVDTKRFVTLYTGVEDWIHAMFSNQEKRTIVHRTTFARASRLHLDFCNDNVSKRFIIFS